VDYTEYNWSDEMILVADDDLQSCIILEKVFEKTGVKTKIAYDGIDALEIIKTDISITMAIVDIRMPKLNGYELVEKAIKIRPDIIYIAYTADIFQLDRKKCADIGFFTILPKPILPSILVETLDKVLIARKSRYRSIEEF
jgi:CheY-like chemotaxis protein